MKRVATGLILAAALLAIVLLAPTWGFALGVALAAVLGVRELDGLARRSGWEVQPWVASALAVGACAAFLQPDRASDWILMLSAACCVGMVLVGLARGQERALSRAAVTLFAGYYPGVLLAYLVGLRSAEDGRALLMFLFVIVWASDIAAYYLGKAFGRRALAPQISPKKTVEGALAGLSGAALVAVLYRELFLPEIGLAAAAGLAVLLAAVGILGDLGESALKRAAGVKDSSGLLPGHGGILDRVDSLLLAGPLFYYYHSWAMQS